MPQLLCAARAEPRRPRHPLQGQLLTLRNVRSGGAGWPDTHGFSKGVKIRGDGLSPRNRSTRAKYWAWERVFSAAAPPAAPDPLGDGKKQGTLLSRDLSIRICQHRLICCIYACQERRPGCLFLSRQCHPVGRARHSSRASQPHRAGAGTAPQRPGKMQRWDPCPVSPWCTGAASGHFHSARAPHYLLSLIPPLLPAAQRGHKDVIYLGVQLNPTHGGLQPAQGQVLF